VIGLSGAHRTGKTTLAEAFAKEQDIIFLRTSATEVFKAAGLDPASNLTIEQRIAVQEAMLQVFEQHYAAAAKKSNVGLFVADRTPIDLAAYLLAEVQQNTSKELTDQTLNFATHYVARCLDATNRWFSTVVIIQPGITVVDAEGKARGCPLFMEHLNSLMLGLCADERLRSRHFYIPRKYVSLDARLRALKNAVSHGVNSFLAESDGLVRH